MQFEGLAVEEFEAFVPRFAGATSKYAEAYKETASLPVGSCLKITDSIERLKRIKACVYGRYKDEQDFTMLFKLNKDEPALLVMKTEKQQSN